MPSDQQNEDGIKVKKTSMLKKFTQDREILFNLIGMISLWSAAAFGYTLIGI